MTLRIIRHNSCHVTGSEGETLCDAEAGSGGLTWEAVTNVEPQAPLQPTESSWALDPECE